LNILSRGVKICTAKNIDEKRLRKYSQQYYFLEETIRGDL